MIDINIGKNVPHYHRSPKWQGLRCRMTEYRMKAKSGQILVPSKPVYPNVLQCTPPASHALNRKTPPQPATTCCRLYLAPRKGSETREKYSYRLALRMSGARRVRHRSQTVAPRLDYPRWCLGTLYSLSESRDCLWTWNRCYMDTCVRLIHLSLIAKVKRAATASSAMLPVLLQRRSGVDWGPLGDTPIQW